MKNKNTEEEKINGVSLETVVFLFFEMMGADNEYRTTVFCGEKFKNLEVKRNAYEEIIEKLGLMESYNKFAKDLTWERISKFISDSRKEESKK